MSSKNLTDLTVQGRTYQVQQQVKTDIVRILAGYPSEPAPGASADQTEALAALQKQYEEVVQERDFFKQKLGEVAPIIEAKSAADDTIVKVSQLVSGKKVVEKKDLEELKKLVGVE